MNEREVRRETDGPPPGIDRDFEMVFEGISALRDLASDEGKACDGPRVYDFGIRWGTLLSGRLKRLEHYHRSGELTEAHESRYRELVDELEEASPFMERLGVAKPRADGSYEP